MAFRECKKILWGYAPPQEHGWVALLEVLNPGKTK